MLSEIYTGTRSTDLVDVLPLDRSEKAPKRVGFLRRPNPRNPRG